MENFNELLQKYADVMVPAACFFCAGRWTEPAPGGILGADVLHHRRV